MYAEGGVSCLGEGLLQSVPLRVITVLGAGNADGVLLQRVAGVHGRHSQLLLDGIHGSFKLVSLQIVAENGAAPIAQHVLEIVPALGEEGLCSLEEPEGGDPFCGILFLGFGVESQRFQRCSRQRHKGILCRIGAVELLLAVDGNLKGRHFFVQLRLCLLGCQTRHIDEVDVGIGIKGLQRISVGAQGHVGHRQNRNHNSDHDPRFFIAFLHALSARGNFLYGFVDLLFH